LTIVQQTSQGVGKLKVADGNVDRPDRSHPSRYRSIAGDFTRQPDSNLPLMREFAAGFVEIRSRSTPTGEFAFLANRAILTSDSERSPIYQPDRSPVSIATSYETYL
jgi:hypothetical protein